MVRCSRHKLTIDYEMIAGVQQFVNYTFARGKRALFVTNTSTRSRQTILRSLTSMGFANITVDHIVTVTFLVAQYLKQLNVTGSVYVVGDVGLREELNLMNISNFGIGPDEYEFIGDQLVPEIEINKDVQAVVVGYDKHISIKKMIKAASYAKRVKQGHFIATNIDRTFLSTQQDVVVPGGGAFAAMIAYPVELRPIVIGKPSKLFWTVLKRVSNDIIKESNTLMIGDQPETDIAFAKTNAIAKSLLVGSGLNCDYEFANSISEPLRRPDYFAASLASLNKYF